MCQLRRPDNIWGRLIGQPAVLRAWSVSRRMEKGSVREVSFIFLVFKSFVC